MFQCVINVLGVIGYTWAYFEYRETEKLPVWIFVPLTTGLLKFWPGFYFFKYFRKDNVETRNNLVKAHQILIFLNIWLHLWESFGVFLTPDEFWV